ncbi:deoxyguanosinetriphosphate triphosphohydrolase [bacterium]|nr:deoxyguanosinetriphosphate triphosphohydrolase [bacterium]
MCIREDLERLEEETLSPRACLSRNTRGRQRHEDLCPIRPAFQRDRDRVVHSKTFRRLKHKTQVFLAPFGDHYRTRLTHTLEVSQIARTIAKALYLNETLTEAIAMGHDLGHTPFGHAGEEVLNRIHPCGFKHNEQSLRVVDKLEKGGKGLNLTMEVRDGILYHSKGRGDIIPKEDRAMTLEGEIVRIADIVAYVNHDIDDALRAGIIEENDLPDRCAEILGKTVAERINTLVKDIIYSTIERKLDGIAMSEDVLKATDMLREFLYDNVYYNPVTRDEFDKASKIIEELYSYYLDHTDLIIAEAPQEEGEGKERIVCDFIAGMTDHYALMTYERIFLPQPWMVL